MATKKQRRRQLKERRHEYEYVYVDDEGQEVEVEDEEPQPSASPAKAKDAKGRGRPAREPKPPSWERQFKRAPVFGVLLFLVTSLSSHGLPFGGLVVNRIHPRFAGAEGDPVGSPLADRLAQIAGEFDQVRRREEHSLRRLEPEVPRRSWVRIPYLTREVASLGALAEVAATMFAGSEHVALR